jgi:MFS family permease
LRGRLLPLIVACALFIENMDSTVLSTSLPAIAIDLGTDPIALKLALTTYLLSLAVFIPVSGWVADRFGARSTFMTAIAVFLLGSVGCAASDSLGALVAGRFVQGMGGAMMVPVGRLVLLRTVPKHDLVQALSWLTIPALVGPMVGPPLGGFITTYFDWRWIFLINLPMGVLGIALAWRFIPDVRGDARPLDWLGFALAGCGLGAALFGFSTFGRHLVPLEIAATTLVLGVAGLIGYGWHARRHPQPLLDLNLFRLATYRAGVLGGLLFRIGIGATPFLLPLMFQLGFGLSPVQSGLLTFVSAMGAMFMKTLAARILKRCGFRRVLLWNALRRRRFCVLACSPQHAAPVHHRHAASQRLLPLPAVHEPERHQLCRGGFAAPGAGEQPRRHVPTAGLEHGRCHRRLPARDRRRRQRTRGDGRAELLLGFSRRRLDLGELRVVDVAAAAQRRRRDGRPRAPGSGSGGAQAGATAGHLGQLHAGGVLAWSAPVNRSRSNTAALGCPSMRASRCCSPPTDARRSKARSALCPRGRGDRA